MPRTGLVLTGGGARAAYQAGVLKGVADLLGPLHDPFPFQVLCGVSAGAINAAVLGCRADGFYASAQGLYRIWHDIRVEQVFRTDPAALSGLAARWLRDLSLGGVLGGSSATYLLDAAPLRGFLRPLVDLDTLGANLETGRLHGFGVSATCYSTGTAMTFFAGGDDIQPWVRSFRLGLREDLTLDHVLASAAIPIFFPPVRVRGRWFGDGCIRLTSPLSPAIHMGADRVLAIGIRYQRPGGATLDIHHCAEMGAIALADIAGTLLNAIFLDMLEADAERMLRINQTLRLLSPAAPTGAHAPHRLRQIPLLVVRPSEDLGLLAAEEFRRFPRTLRYLLRGIGASDEKGWDLLSYLAFDPAYTRRLLELGEADAQRHRHDLARFLEVATQRGTATAP